MILAGDVGGTKTYLALFDREGGPRAVRREATFPCEDYSSLETLVSDFLSDDDLPLEAACFGVAGPVVGGRVAVTNLPWVIDEAYLRAGLSVSAVRLLNDLEAVAWAVPHLRPAELHTLNAGQPVPGGAKAIIAPGTGLGEAFLTWDGERYLAHASEGGHTDFGPTDALELELARHLQRRWDHVSYERVCSGLGLPNIYAFLKASGKAPEPVWLAERLAGADDPTPIIVEEALKGSQACDLCVMALDLFTSILGAEAGNLALKVLATGGVYLGGGIPIHILPALEGERFLHAFRRKGRFADLMARMPVHVILYPQAAWLGAAVCALRL